MAPKWSTQQNTALKDYGFYLGETRSEQMGVTCVGGGQGGGVGWTSVMASHINSSCKKAAFFFYHQVEKRVQLREHL